MGKTRDQGNLVTDGRPILGSNEIGIGTDNPLASLDVRGNMLVDNISVAGTITYDDVTSVDSIGIVTARSGIHVTGGNVGILTDNPQAVLHIRGDNVRHQGINPYIEFYQSDGTLSGYLQSRSDELRLNGVGNLPLTFGTNDTEKLRIDSSGNIRIPFISNATGLRQKIQFVTEANFFDEVAYIAMDRTAVSMAPTDMVFATGQVNSVSERVRITSDGNFGIGVTPNVKLQVKLDTNKHLYFQGNIGEIGNVPGIQGVTDSGALASLGLRGSDLRFATGSAERVRITSDGDVNVIGGNLSVGLDTSTLDFTDSNNFTRFVEVGADGANGGDALLVTHSSGKGVGYFGYESGGDRLVVACDNGGGNNKIDFILNAGTTTGGATDNLNSATPAMRIDANGVVRINETAAITASATPRLFVRTASSTSTTDIVAKFGNNNTTTSSESVIAMSAGYLLSNTDTEGHVQFGVQRSGNGNRAGFIVKTWDGGSNFNRHLRVDYLGGTNIMRSNYGGTHDSGNTGDNWWKVGEFRDITMGWRGHLTLMGTQSYSAGAINAGHTTINLCIVNNDTVTGHFYGHSGQTGTVKGVATKYDAATDILEIWVQPVNSYAGFGVIPNASFGGWYAASTNTGSNALPSGASSLASHVYFQTQGTNALVINSNQQITTPVQPSFRAGRSGSYTPGANTDIIFNSVHHNVGSHYNNTNGRFTVPVAGTYIFAAHVIWQNVSNGQAMDDCFYIAVNGATVGYSGRRAEFVEGTTGNAAYFTDFNTYILNLSANDYVTIENRFAGLQVHGNVNYTTFAGYLLG